MSALSLTGLPPKRKALRKMVSFDYAFHHFECVVRLCRGDETALNDLDNSADGFWRSFAAVLFAFPAMFFGWVMEARDMISTGSERAMFSLVTTNGFLELALWFVPILLLAFVLKWVGYAQGYSSLIIVRNWFSAIAAYVYTLLVLPSLFIPGFSAPILLIFIVLFGLIYLLIRLTRICLQCDTALASGLVIGEFFLMIALTSAFYHYSDYYAGTALSS